MTRPISPVLSLVRWFALALVLVSGASFAQQKAGEVTHLQGMATAQQPGGGFRFLSQGDAVLQGDVLTTTDKGFAVVSLDDGTKFTLRPASRFALDRFSRDPGTESLSMRLLAGGMRFVSGLIGKRNPQGVALRINTATIGIRGTSFDARICGDDCRQENQSPAATTAQTSTSAMPPVVARVVQSSGEITATLPGHAARSLGVGAALYEGDDVRSGAAGVAVIGFRDQSRVSVNPKTAFRIDAFNYKRPEAPDGMALSLLKGGLRAFTGLIGKASPTSFSVRTRTSTIGIRGTGMDISCEGPCVDDSVRDTDTPAGSDNTDPQQTDGLFMLVWEGSTYFIVGPLDVPLDKVGFIGRNGVPRLLANTPEFFTNFGSPRPDQVVIDWENLFATTAPSGNDGIYIVVRDGHVFMLSGDSRVDMGVGEAGFVGVNGRAFRLSLVPGFLTGDPYPIPELFTQSTTQIFQLFGVTMGQAGQEICRL